MTLHEAIAQLLRQSEGPMTAREIADGLNKNKWYTKADKSEIKSSQITARVDDHHELFDIDRSISPLKIKLFGSQLKPIHCVSSIITKTKTLKTVTPKSIASYLKTSFDPISNSETNVLILGTMPGDKSLELNEYYGHSRNKFWKESVCVKCRILTTEFWHSDRYTNQTVIYCKLTALIKSSLI